jgi:hypothetical protein
MVADMYVRRTRTTVKMISHVFRDVNSVYTSDLTILRPCFLLSAQSILFLLNMLSIKFPSSQLTLVVLSTLALIVAGSVESRELQTAAKFRANYSAEFQHLRDNFCLGDAPIIQVTCFGNLTFLGTSDPSIQCSKLSIPDTFVNGTTYQCINTCVESDCQSIYLAVDGLAAKDGPFGSIKFSCEGDTVRDVDAFMNYLGGNNGTCAAAFGTSTRNLHIARLGVSCSAGSTLKYVYDDTYFECYSPDTFYFNTANGQDDIYTCGTGESCSGVECVVPFSDIYVNADLPILLDSCVESLLGDPVTSFPTSSPMQSSLDFSARFVASWGRLFDPLTSLVTCTSGNPTITVSCENAASISFVNSSDSFLNCTNVGANTMKCLSDDAKIDNVFTDVFYVSIVTCRDGRYIFRFEK